MKKENFLIRCVYKIIRQKRQLINFGWRYSIFFAFILMTAVLFTVVQQGQDVLWSTLEYSWGSFFLLFSILFWAYCSWYTARLIGYAALQHMPIQPRLFKYYNTHIPRVLGFLCFSVVEYALINLLAYKLIDNYGNICFIAYMLFKLLIYRFINHQKVFHDFKKKLLWHLLAVQMLLLLQTILLVNIDSHQLRIMLMTLVVAFNSVLFLIFTISRHTQPKKDDKPKRFEGTRQFIGHVNSKEPAYTYTFYTLSTIAAILYTFGIISLNFSRIVGPCNFYFLGTTIMQLGMGLITLVSVLNRINYHVPLLVMVLLLNLVFKTDPYKVSMISANRNNGYASRMSLDQYFDKYLEAHQSELDSTNKLPLYFVLSDGGASRSAFWVAGSLSLLNDSSQGYFTNHLFCMSGASGGSVGNASFFALQKNRSTNMFDNTVQYYDNDFLTYTLARMLGPDYFRHLFAFIPMYDRAAALEYAHEKVPNEKIISNAMAAPFDIEMQQQNGLLNPILYINTTVMQTGVPAVVSNLNIDSVLNNNRVDVLELLGDSSKLKLSTAAILSARFPYVSPAGKISTMAIGNERNNLYFVDGGYFDNSGAGVVTETIQHLDRLITKNKNKYGHVAGKIEFVVLHITNSPKSKLKFEKTPALQNDLFAPVKTLAGAYSKQTDINDLRLKKLLTLINERSVTPTKYHDIPLYKTNDPDEKAYSMNWFMSDDCKARMQKRFATCTELHSVIKEVNEKNKLFSTSEKAN